MRERITGFDLARALAIFGMVIVNFKIAMNAKMGNQFLIWFSSLFEGRASALFVILAGIGVAFMTNKVRSSTDKSLVIKTRLLLAKRGLLLILIGLAYTTIWEADILHFYGFYFFIAASIFLFKEQTLINIAVVIVLIFPVLMIFFDYENGWNWSTLTYNDFWSVNGMFRHIVFNGFHPIFPWSAFLVYGIWLGRLDLSDKRIKNKLIIWSLLALVITEGSFYLFRDMLGDGASVEMTVEEVNFLFSTSIIPPLPQYVISAASSATLILLLSLYVSEKFSGSIITKWLYQTGQLSLTLYVAHVIIGMGFLEAIGRLNNQTIEYSLSSAVIFCMVGVVFSVLWLKYFKTGPLEWVFRKLAN